MKKTMITLAVSAAMLTVQANTIESNTNDRKSLEMVIYNSDLGLIKDTRAINEKSNNIVDLEFKGVSGKINARTSILDGVGKVYEQNFNYDILSQQSLFKRSVGKTIKVTDKVFSTTYEATILNFVNDVAILKNIITGEIVSLNINSKDYIFSFKEVPNNLRAKPTLSLKVKDLEDEISLTYLTSGLSWSSDYVANVNKDSTTMSLNGWVTLNNNSLVEYKNVSLSLLAGEVNRVRPQMLRRKTAVMEMAMSGVIADDSLQSEDVADYKSYKIPFKVDIQNNQQKQIALFHRHNIPVTKEYVFDGNVQSSVKKAKANVYLSFKNTEKNNLGLALPTGTIRFYENSSNTTFIGEHRINHTSINEKVRARIGEAFDLTLNKKVKENKRLSKYESIITVEYNLINGSKADKEVIVSESSYGRELELMFSKEDIKLLDDISNNNKKFKANIKADSENTFEVKYRIVTH